uniref:hypothetical protein n=1 Tax=Paracoccus sp. TaxID=267 RepID=UPI00321FE241
LPTASTATTATTPAVDRPTGSDQRQPRLGDPSMPATLFRERLPQVAHVGFDHGWLLLGPSFLNLGMPMLLVDRVFLGDVAAFGLERFGTRDPHTRLPKSHLVVERSGRFIGIRGDRSTDGTLIAIGAFSDPTCLDPLSVSKHLVLAVGETWAAEHSWSALWRFCVGVASVRLREASLVGW